MLCVVYVMDYEMKCSGQDHTVIQRRVAAIQRLESQQQISGFMDSGLITTTAPIHPTVTPMPLSINPRSLHSLTSPFYCYHHTSYLPVTYVKVDSVN